MTNDETPEEFDLGAPAEGDGYYQAKTRQWIDLCPHLGPSDRTVLRVLTDLTTHASKRRKVSLDELRGVVTTNPVQVGEDPKPISASGLLRILRNLASLGQITADEDGTPLTFSSRKTAQARAVTMTIWRLPRHECGCHRNVFDALAAARGREPRFEPARVDVSAVRRRPKQAGQKSNPEEDAGQKSNPGGQKSNPGGQESDPHPQDDQQKRRSPITPPSTLSSSSSGGTETSPVSVGGGEEEDAPSVRTTPSVAQVVMNRTGSTADEAQAVIESIEDHAERNKIEIGSIGRYINGFDDSDLRRHLRKIRAQRASEDRAEASQSAGPDSQCETHHEPMDCSVCAKLHPLVAKNLLRQYGPVRRPDLARRASVLV